MNSNIYLGMQVYDIVRSLGTNYRENIFAWIKLKATILISREFLEQNTRYEGLRVYSIYEE